jgi:hypothetical protein
MVGCCTVGKGVNGATGRFAPCCAGGAVVFSAACCDGGGWRGGGGRTLGGALPEGTGALPLMPIGLGAEVVLLLLLRVGAADGVEGGIGAIRTGALAPAPGPELALLIVVAGAGFAPPALRFTDAPMLLPPGGGFALPALRFTDAPMLLPPGPGFTEFVLGVVLVRTGAD